MISFISALMLLGLALLAIVMRKAYHSVPTKELKRRAAAGDAWAQQYYRAVAYGHTLDVLLWFIIGCAGAGGFIILSRLAPVALSFIAVVLLIWVFYAILPVSRMTSWGNRVTLLLTPFVARLLHGLHPLLRRGAYVIEKRSNSETHTGLFERRDLLELIEKQLHQPDSRFSTEELMIVAQTLNFNDVVVHDILTPWSRVTSVTVGDVVGPVMIDEAHRSGQPLLPVVTKAEGSAEQVVGTLQVHQLGIESHGSAADVMDKVVYYLHEDDSLTEALHAFYVTNQPQFIVLDSSGAYVGIVTMSAMLHKLLGELPGAAAEVYMDYSDVSHRHNAVQSPSESVIPSDNSEEAMTDSLVRLIAIDTTATEDKLDSSES
jgi:CBS domain containing-hemolysin-like protein